MSLDSAASTVPVIVRTEDKVLNVRLTISSATNTNGNPVDISAASEIKAILLNADASKLIKLLSTSGIVLTNGPGGRFQIILAAADTALLALSPSGGDSDIEVHVTIAGKLTIVLLTGVYQVIDPLFP